MSKMSAADKQGFEVVSVVKALASSPGKHVCVATKGDVEVWATEYRGGPQGRRHTAITFEALRIVERFPNGARRCEAIELPATHHSDLVKVLDFLAPSIKEQGMNFIEAQALVHTIQARFDCGADHDFSAAEYDAIATAAGTLHRWALKRRDQIVDAAMPDQKKSRKK